MFRDTGRVRTSTVWLRSLSPRAWGERDWQSLEFSAIQEDRSALAVVGCRNLMPVAHRLFSATQIDGPP